MPTFSYEVGEEIQQKRSFDALPKGKYRAIINNTAIKPTRAGTGEYLAVTFQIIEGDHSGRRIWQNLNLSNRNKTAEDIARQELNTICAAVGIASGTRLQQTEELHDIPLVIDVGLDSKDETRNRIYGYEPDGAVAAPKTKPASSSSKKPWEK
jgi:hypothetical protein